MKRTTMIVASLVTLSAWAGTLQQAAAQGSSDLAGGWLVTSWTNAAGETDTTPQKGLFVFTANGNYSIMYVLGDEPRAEYSGDSQSDAEVLSAYGSFVANSGRYTVTGNRFVYEAYMAKDPNYMAQFSAAERTNGVTVEWAISDGILSLHWIDGPTPGLKATLRKPTGQS